MVSIGQNRTKVWATIDLAKVRILYMPAILTMSYVYSEFFTLRMDLGSSCSGFEHCNISFDVLPFLVPRNKFLQVFSIDEMEIFFLQTIVETHEPISTG
jgi:hypothetical protein